MSDTLLTGKSQGALDQEDQLLTALTTLAYADKPVNNKARTSRFWFQVETTSQMVEKKKKSLSRKPIEHIDAEVEARLLTYETELSPVLKDKITKVREFFLTEIAPLTFATAGGSLQSKAVAERMLETEVDPAIFNRFENMVNRAATIKLALFVLDYFGLPQSHFNSLIGNGRPDSEMSQLITELTKTQDGMQQTQNGFRRVTKEFSDATKRLSTDAKK